MFPAALGCLLLLTGCLSDSILEVPLQDVDIIKLYSSATDTEYRIYVSLPVTYRTTTDSFPVLYQLDGNTTTGFTVHNAQTLADEGLIIQPIVVSLDYENSNRRERDYTPTFVERFEESGHADAFYAFLTTELIPHINSKYRTDTTFGNTLKGHSLGGLFASYALFRYHSHSSAFHHYIIESPSWWWDNGYILSLEQEYALHQSLPPANVYVSVGQLEQGPMKLFFRIMEEKFQEHGISNLHYTFEEIENATHLDTRNNRNGLNYIFRSQ